MCFIYFILFLWGNQPLGLSQLDLTANSPTISIQHQTLPIYPPSNASTSFLAISFHLIFGILKVLLPTKLCSITILSSKYQLLIAYPAHHSFPFKIVNKMFVLLFIISIPLFFFSSPLFYYVTFMGPKTFHIIFLSSNKNLFSSAILSVQVSNPYRILVI